MDLESDTLSLTFRVAEVKGYLDAGLPPLSVARLGAGAVHAKDIGDNVTAPVCFLTTSHFQQ